MKRMKKISIALLGIALACMPVLASCGESDNNDGGGNNSQQEEKTLKSIEIAKQPTKLNYEVGDKFDPTGMVVNAIYSDGSKEEAKGYSYNKMPLSASDKRITISYKGKTAYVDISVKFVLKCTRISIEVLPTKRNYIVGETFDPTGMKVVGYYNDNTKKTISDFKIDKTGPLTLKDTAITISFGELYTTLTIKVEEVKALGIEISKAPTKLAYLVGEKFDATGIEFVKVTNDGKKTPLDAKEVTFDEKEALTLKDELVTFTYKEFKTSLTISVSNSKLKSISFKSEPKKNTYYEGDNFDMTDVVIEANYEDGSKEVIKNYSTSKTTKLTLEDNNITFSFGGKTLVYPITVKEKLTSVVVDNLKTVRIEAEHLDTSNATLRQDFIDAGRGFIENGKGASNGQNICGYNPGSKFSISIDCKENAEVIISSIMSDTDIGYDFNKSVKISVDDKVLNVEDPHFKIDRPDDFWHWIDFKLGKVSLTKGKHTFTIESISRRPNLDCFDFKVIKYADKVATKELKSLVVKKAPTKTSYNEGEKFDKTGLEIEALYDDYTKEIVTDFTIKETGALTGENKFVTVQYKDKIVNVPITVKSKYNFSVNESKTVRFEAEDVDKTHLESDGGPFVENSGDKSSNGKNLGHIAGGYATIKFNLNEEFKTTIKVLIASHAPEKVSQKIESFYIDNNKLSYEDLTLGAAKDNQYWNYKTVTLNANKLAKGEHTFKINFIVGPNLDYFEFSFAK